ncbi:uncharacterized protein F4822DRAFT_399218 [Hypoxylon trugodes]|uniref:uncharacterized protein n=1 Tax=Hypoxylon trugodes TaxID=326681 RepID=UPI00218F1255|nr:uncharacterized protein F4822DRAFT_399218 [Hypoxylon trugodes]KAI1389673.1 hypothetical protein F4822DRAFT_399218 [Hypoxylon trugodes]
MGLHLPLSPNDRVLRPPLYYLQVQDGLILGSGAMWTITYILYVVQAYRDKSYGMPLVSLCANISWELLYGVVYPTSVGQFVAFTSWLITDIGIVYVTIKFGPSQWKQAPMVANNLGLLLTAGIGTMIAMHLAFIKQIPSLDECALWSAFVCQVLLSGASVLHLMCRDNTSGHSWTIWLIRWLGTVLVIGLFVWRWVHYPETYPITAKPVTVFLFVLTEIADIIYPFVYYAVEKKEKLRKQVKQVKSK